jgi:HK97 gp10 family phage protein
MMTVKVIGGDKLLKRLESISKDGEDRFQDLVVDTATFAHRQAVNHINQNVGTGTGHLKQSMYIETGELFAEVGNRADYAGFVEFGTGKMVSVPPEFSEIASKVKSRPTKSFEEGLQAIRDWCKMKGIETRAAYPIFMSILRRGVMPRPFMYPAYKMAARYMQKEAAKMIKELTKKKS